jgi:hypothetical protein
VVGRETVSGNVTLYVTKIKLKLRLDTLKKLKKGAQIPGDQIFYGGT